MEKIENEYFVINYSKSLSEIVKKMISISTKKVPEIFAFFHIKSYRKVTVNLFDSIDEFKYFVFLFKNQYKYLLFIFSEQIKFLKP